MNFFIKDFFSKCYQIGSFLRIWSYLQNKFLKGNFIFCAVCGSSKQKLHVNFLTSAKSLFKSLYLVFLNERHKLFSTRLHIDNAVIFPEPHEIFSRQLLQNYVSTIETKKIEVTTL